ncbi:MAG TPA: hypothetical protein VJ761_21915 [Ktedonobacteraceae bacterium]|nr:hypothetical protein [Ktedonobacteraceae bacterium]
MSSADIIIGIANVLAQLAVAGVAVWAVLASLHANKKQIASSEAQLSKQIEESRRLAIEERQQESRPIIAPKKKVSHTTVTFISRETWQTDKSFYTPDKAINWAWEDSIRICLHNMGNGPAFNLHALFYGPQASSHSQFVSWDNGPIESKSPLDIDLVHSAELRLLHDEVGLR